MKYLRQLTYKEKKTYLVHSFEGLALAGLQVTASPPGMESNGRRAC
jgi:hypothetical protein